MTAPATAPTTEFSVFLPFGKVDKQPDGTLMVHTVLNDETVDDQGEIVDFSAVEKASADYMAWANVREMHSPETAAGTMVSLTPNPGARTHEAILHVVDPVAVQKVSAGVYKGTSLGGFKRRLRLTKSATGDMVRHVTEIDWRETSLVDRPSRPTARLTLLKRSDGGDPPPLVEEDLMDEEATVATPETPTDAPLAKVTAPEAGTDAYTDAAGAPVAAESVAEVATEPTVEPLAKSAADDVVTIHIVAESLDRLIEAECDDPEQVAILRQMRALASQFEGAESAEVGTPEDAAESAAENGAATMPAMAYASQIGDLGAIVAAAVDEALAKRATPAIPVPEPTTPEEPSAVDEILAKTTSYLDERFARYVSRPDLEAMKGEILGALGPIKEDLAKVARFPAPGGPLRFAADGDRFAADEGDSSTEAEVLAKAAQKTSDPHLREELGRLAAAAQFASDRRR